MDLSLKAPAIANNRLIGCFPLVLLVLITVSGCRYFSPEKRLSRLLSQNPNIENITEKDTIVSIKQIIQPSDTLVFFLDPVESDTVIKIEKYLVQVNTTDSGIHIQAIRPADTIYQIDTTYLVERIQAIPTKTPWQKMIPTIIGILALFAGMLFVLLILIGKVFK